VLALTDGGWSALTHAYGAASDIPALIELLHTFPTEGDHRSEPWFSLWSALCHQGDVYSASFAAVPHILKTLASDPSRASMSFFLLPTAIELARRQHGISVPDSLAAAYHGALAKIPGLAAQVAGREWDADFGRAVLAAIAIAKGQIATARLLTEVDSDDTEGVLEWYLSR
jgi:hypothetical protein